MTKFFIFFILFFYFKAQIKRDYKETHTHRCYKKTGNVKMTQYCLKKVLMMVRVVRCFRNITDHLSSFSPIQRLRSPRFFNTVLKDSKSTLISDPLQTELQNNIYEKKDHISHFQLSSIKTVTAKSDATLIATSSVITSGCVNILPFNSVVETPCKCMLLKYNFYNYKHKLILFILIFFFVL